MSLLMDALKKAEQEKKEAAKRLEQASELARIERTGEHPADITAEHEAVATGDAPEAPPPATAVPSPLSLAPMHAEALAATETSESAPPAEPAADEPGSEAGSRSAGLRIERSGPPIAPEEPTQAVAVQAPEDLDQTFHGVALQDEAMAGMFEETVQGEPFEAVGQTKPYEETLPGVPAVQFARDIGGKDQPTPVAAQTVFSAGETGRQATASGMKWAYLVLPLIVIAAGLVWYYYTVTPVNRKLPSPLVARGIETILPGAPNIVPPAETAVASAAPAAGVQVQPPPAASATEAAPAAAAPAPEAAAPAVPPQETAATAPAPAAPAQAPAAGTPAGEKPTAPAPMAEAPETPKFGAAPSLVQIRKGRKPSDSGRLIQQAYADYNAGNLAAAKSGYRQALDKVPDNLDALLGLGAIALKEHDADRALDVYAHILRLDPRNETALAAVISMQKDNDLLDSESSLKTLLQADADNPYLNFTLGTVYAGQQRWAEAQQAFFDAYRNDSSNPDYALNLAISLDRLGQRETALDYYNTALKLADDRPAGFDSGAVLARVQELSAPPSAR